MRYLLVIFITIICAFPQKGNAQINLVYNGSFEDIKQCPTTRNQIKYANYWSPLDTLWDYDTSMVLPMPGCNPDLFSICGMYPWASLPAGDNFFFHYPRTGKNLVQILVYKNIQDTSFTGTSLPGYFRDYLQGRLRNNLSPGKTYCITFYISLNQVSRFACNKLGAYLDDGTIDTVCSDSSGLVQSMYTPQVYDTTIYTDTLHWHKIQGTFRPEGNERFITIGNFFDDAHTDTVGIQIPTPHNLVGGGDKIFGIYLIDDVSVIAADAVANAGRDTTITLAAGDSAWVGVQGDYVPCRWYSATGVLIDSNIGGFKVKPAATTSYIMELEVCGHVTRDTVTITVKPVSIVNGQLLMVNVRLYPNPATASVTIENARGMEVAIYDVVGRKVSSFISKTSKDELDIAHLCSGTYLVKITDPHSGENTTLRLVKE